MRRTSPTVQALAALCAVTAPLTFAVPPTRGAAIPRSMAPGGSLKRQTFSLLGTEGPITIHADHLSGSLGLGPVFATGHVVVQRSTFVLRADEVTYDPSAQVVRAAGSVEIETPFGLLRANELQYDVTSGGGSGALLHGLFQGFNVRAERFELVPPALPGEAPVVIARDGAITSCTFDRPDYLLSARWIRLQPRNSLKLQGMAVKLFGVKLITLPYAAFDLRPRPKGRPPASSPLPGVGISTVAGPFVRWSEDTRFGPGLDGQEQIVLSTRMGVTGGLNLNQVGGTPLQFSLYHRAEIPRYQYPRLTLDRLPELRIPFGVSYAAAPGYATVVGEAVAGHYREYGHTASGNRLMLREAALWRPGKGFSHPLIGVGLTTSLYSGGAYAIGGLGVGYEAQLGREIQGAAVVNTSASSGRTPFVFDALEAARAFEITATSVNSRWGWTLDSIYDLRNHRLYDGEVTIAHTLKCLRPSLGFRFRNRQILFGMTIPALEELEPRRPSNIFRPGAGQPAFHWNEGESLPTVHS